MRIRFKDWVEVHEVLKYNTGVKLQYGKGTMKGIAWCPCGRGVGQVFCNKQNKVYGWFDTECTRCGNELNWSDAFEHIKFYKE